MKIPQSQIASPQTARESAAVRRGVDLQARAEKYSDVFQALDETPCDIMKADPRLGRETNANAPGYTLLYDEQLNPEDQVRKLGENKLSGRCLFDPATKHTTFLDATSSVRQGLNPTSVCMRETKTDTQWSISHMGHRQELSIDKASGDWNVKHSWFGIPLF